MKNAATLAFPDDNPNGDSTFLQAAESTARISVKWNQELDSEVLSGSFSGDAITTLGNYAAATQNSSVGFIRDALRGDCLPIETGAGAHRGDQFRQFRR